MKTNKSVFFIIVLVTLLLGYVSFMGLHVPLMGWDIKGANEMRWGIDIRGGVDAVFVPKDLGRAPTSEELEAARAVIETRLDQNNILDREVAIDTTSGAIIVRFPWKTGETDFDPSAAIQELGEMAELTFRDPDHNVVISGKDVKSNTNVSLNENGMNYDVNIELTPEGQAAFAEATGRLIGKQIFVYLDYEEGMKSISDPKVNEKIDSDRVRITGSFTRAEAQDLANKIAAGSLPFALTTYNYSTISPTLGNNSLDVMLWAGLLAFVLICLYLLFYYRVSGIVAVIALGLQVAGILLILSVPQITVTLQGIAGIILSIGMGVDANIIIAERIRDELRAGKPIDSAVQAGFKRAFSAVFDGNLTMLIVAVIMMIFGSGDLLSFAYTLTFGIVMNFVAGVFANRMMTQSITRIPAFRKNTGFMSESFMKREIKTRDFYGKRKITFIVSALIMLFGVAMIFVNVGQGQDAVPLDIQFKGGAIFRYTINNPDSLNADEAANLVEKELNRLTNGQITQDFSDNESRLVLSLAAGDNLSNEDIANMEAALKEKYPDQNLTPAGSNNVSAYYGQKFLRNGIVAIVLSALLVLIYVWFSFRRIHGLSAGVMALAALLHDVLVVFFAFIIFGIPIGDTFVAVILTILGYSINDTIVIYDRIRENALFDPAMQPDILVNRSISQVLTRTINTNLMVIIAVTIIYVFAAIYNLESIRSFALPMAIGSVSGCYSTICIAGPLWVMWQKRKNRSTLTKKRS